MLSKIDMLFIRACKSIQKLDLQWKTSCSYVIDNNSPINIQVASEQRREMELVAIIKELE